MVREMKVESAKGLLNKITSQLKQHEKRKQEIKPAEQPSPKVESSGDSEEDE